MLATLPARLQTPRRFNRESETIQHTLLECRAIEKERGEFLGRLCEFHPVARGLSVEGHCRLLMGGVLPRRETENTVYRLRMTRMQDQRSTHLWEYCS